MRPLPGGSGTARGAAQSLLRTHPAELSTFCISAGRTGTRSIALRGSAFAALLPRACFPAYSDCCVGTLGKEPLFRAECLLYTIPARRYACCMCVPCCTQCLLYACSARHSAFCLHVSWAMVPDVHLPFRPGSVHSLESIVPVAYVLCESASVVLPSPTLSPSLLH